MHVLSVEVRSKERGGDTKRESGGYTPLATCYELYVTAEKSTGARRVGGGGRFKEEEEEEEGGGRFKRRRIEV